MAEEKQKSRIVTPEELDQAVKNVLSDKTIYHTMELLAKD